MSVLRDSKVKREIGDISNHVIVIGFGRIGHVVSYVLRKKGVNYLILDNNHRIVRLEKNNGYNIYYGDAMNIDILRHIGIEKAEALIVVMEDEIACIKITRFIHENFPNVNIIAKSENMNNAERFKKFGANYVVSKNLETGLQVSKTALAAVNVGSNKDIEKTLQSIRESENMLIKEFVRDKKEKDNIRNHSKISSSEI